MREEETHKGKQLPARVEKVVIFLPDIWRLVPTMLEYASLKDSYHSAMLCKLGLSSSKPDVPVKQEQDSITATEPSAAAEESTISQSEQQQQQALILTLSLIR